MNKKTVFTLLGCLLVSLLLVLLLAFFNRETTHSYGFNRALKPNLVTQVNSFDLGYNSFYLSGVTNDHVYLGNYMSPLLLVRKDFTLADTSHLKLSAPETALDWRRVLVVVDSPIVYILEGTTPAILHTELPDLKNFKKNLEQPYFVAAQPISPSVSIRKVFDIRLQQHALNRKIKEQPYDTYSSGVLEPQGDGRFSVAGQLRYDPKTTNLLYVYSYRNEFIKLDSALNIIYKRNTIDTISTAQIEVAQLDGGKELTMSKPPLLVNKNGYLTPSWIFINSALMADNESKESFEKSSVIDIYSVNNGEYQFSFHIPDYKGNKIRDFKVWNNYFLAMQGQYIVIYELNFNEVT